MHTIFLRLANQDVTPTTTSNIRVTNIYTVSINMTITSRRNPIPHYDVGASFIRTMSGRLVFIRTKVIFKNAVSTIRRFNRIRVITSEGTLMFKLTTNRYRMVAINVRFRRLFAST